MEKHDPRAQGSDDRETWVARTPQRDSFASSEGTLGQAKHCCNRVAEQRDLIVAEANTWLNTPFHANACVKGAGVSCGLFLMACYQAGGIEMDWNVGTFPVQWHMHTTEERLLNTIERYTHQVENPEPGDIVVFRCFKGRPFCHAGLVLDWPRVIHAADGDKRGVEYLNVLPGSPLGKREMRFQSPW